MTFKPTDEQISAIEMSLTNQSFKIGAFAGTGKTSTLTLIGGALNRKQCLYLAFNKAIADASQSKFANNVKCRTFHSLAFRATPRHITGKISGERLMPRDLARMMSMRNWEVKNSKEKLDVCTTYDQAMILYRSLECFCRSNSAQISSRHVAASLPSWIKADEAAELIQHLTPKVQDLWDMSIGKSSQFRISHDVYLKHWALSKPIIDADAILFDEAQDADPIMLSIIRNQSSQCIYTGDKHQSIYQWRGAKNAMQSLELPEIKLTQSFRFGSAVADVANIILSKTLGEQVKIKGNPAIKSTICSNFSPTAYIVRTNACALELATELIKKGVNPNILIDTQVVHTQVTEIQELMSGKVTDNRKSCMYGFHSWSEVENFVEHNPSTDIAPIVKLVSKNEPSVIISVIDRIKKIQLDKNHQSDTTITTAHKSKGLEFERAYVHNDFLWNEDDKPNTPLLEDSEARLLYVACTRAIEKLDISRLEPLFKKM